MSAECKKSQQAGISEKELVLLGLIAEEPIHAYGIEEKIRTRHMTEWTEIGFSSIYRLLSRLEEQGFIEGTLEHGGQGATRKVLAIKDAGLAALANGVAEQLTVMQPVKNPFTVGLAFITHGRHGEVIECLEQRLERLQKLEQEIDSFWRGHGDDLPGLPEAPTPEQRERRNFTAGLLVGLILRHLRAEKEFLKDTLRLLQSTEPHLFSQVEAPAAETAAGANTEVKR